jgi:CheY-like chemotaxis protein
VLEHPILVIDDDLTIQQTVAELLDFEGYAVVTASNGAEGLAMLERGRPSLVLLDLRMPVLDGWAFARAARERGFLLRIVVMTAAHDARRWADEVGARAHVAKPFEADDLLRIVRQVLESPEEDAPPVHSPA